MKKLNNTTWKEKPKDDPRDRIEVEVGDSKQDDFFPQSKLMRWDNEVNFSVRLQDVDRRKKKTFKKDKDEKVQWEQGNFTAEFYDVENAHKFVWYLKEKPSTNKVKFSIQSKGLNFYYQPPLELTQEEKDKGWRVDREYERNGEVGNAVLDSDDNVRRFRPEDVVGSYAVYHKNKSNNRKGGKHYRTGKAFHIYRPHIVDAEGKECWGDLNIKNGKYEVTIPQEFLDKAVYPIKSNDTFGYDIEGGSSDSNALNGFISGSIYNTPDNASVSKITLYHIPPTTIDVEAAIYDSSLNFIENTETVSSGSSEWVDVEFNTNPEISSGDYWLSGWGEYYYMGHDFKYDSGDTDQSLWQDVDDNSVSWPDPLDPNGYYDRKYSIYATYTVSNTPPDAPSNPSPSDGATGVSTDTTLSVDVSDPDGDDMDVSFLWGEGGESLNSPGTAVNDSSEGTLSWEDPSYAKVSDDNYTEAYVNTGDQAITHYLKVTDFGFSIPSGATIDGIRVEVEKWQPQSGTTDEYVQIVKSDGSIGSENKAATGTEWPGTEEYSSYGGNADLWSESWSPSDINNSNFGVAISADVYDSNDVQGNYAYIDHVRITVYYTDLIEEVTGVSSGGTAETSALDLDNDTTYNWYAVADDGTDSTQSSTWSFTTEASASTITKTYSIDSYIEINKPSLTVEQDGEDIKLTWTY